MKYKHLIFDFDGVLAETNEIRFEGFRLLFADYPHNQVQKLVEYAKLNGGTSRYEKIKYFFTAIRGEPITEAGVQVLAKRYSELVKDKVISAKPVEGSIEFLSCYYNKYDFAIISGSDQEELREVCRIRKIDHYFDEILGSPVNKESNMNSLMEKTEWDNKLCLYIGDSINDLNAARTNNISFVGRSSGLVDWSTTDNVDAINDISQLQFYLNS